MKNRAYRRWEIKSARHARGRYRAILNQRLMKIKAHRNYKEV